jgi:hypothetical protein
VKWNFIHSTGRTRTSTANPLSSNGRNYNTNGRLILTTLMVAQIKLAFYKFHPIETKKKRLIPLKTSLIG